MEDASLIRSPGSDPRDRIVLALRQQGVLSRAELARITGLAKSTVSEAVSELVDSGLVVATATQRRPTRAGRPGTGVTLNPSAGACVGVDFGFRHVRAVAADVSHTILATKQVPVGADYSLEAGLAAAETIVVSVLKDAGVAAEQVLGIGVAIPGPVDPQRGTVIGTSMIPHWAGVDIRTDLRERFGREVIPDNDSNCAALAEHLWGAGQASRQMAYFKLHSGIGGGIVLDGRVHHGAAGVAGEFGHITLDPAGPPCRCGGRGCLETYAGIPQLLEQLKPRFGGEVTLQQMLDGALKGDLACRRVLADAAELVGHAAATVANTLAPDLIVVGGALAAAGDLLFAPLRASFARSSILARQSDAAAQPTPIVAGALGRDASALGAVALILTRLGLESELQS